MVINIKYKKERWEMLLNKNKAGEAYIYKVLAYDMINFENYDDGNWDNWEAYILDELSIEEKVELIEKVGFKLSLSNGYYKLHDLQGANIDDIESEKFDTVDDVIQGLNVYFYDKLIVLVRNEQEFQAIADKNVKNEDRYEYQVKKLFEEINEKMNALEDLLKNKKER